MSMAVDHLLNAALALSDEDQLQLVAALVSAVEERGLQPFSESALGEIQRRSAEFDAGLIQPVPWTEVKERARNRTRG